MLKILFYIPTLAGGGAERVLVNLVNRLDKSKYDITVQTIFNVGKYRDYLNPDIKYRYNFKRIFRGNTLFFRMFPKSFLYRHFIKERYDIVVSYLESPTTRIVAGCPDKSVKLVNWVHNEMRSENDFLSSFGSKKARLSCFEKYDKNVFVCKSSMDSFLRFMPLENCTVKYNTVESDKIREQAEEQITDSVFDDEKVNLISVGRLVEQKGYIRLLRVCKKLADDGLNFHLSILGEGDKRKELSDFILQNNLSEKVTLSGFRNNPYKYVKSADLFVCSSLHEGYSTAVTESLIVGTPVITVRCSGMDELLENGKYGVITENNETDLYDGLKALLSDKSAITALADKAKLRGDCFSAKSTVAEVETMLDSLGCNTNV